MKTLAIISSQAFSVVNFRGPLIRALVLSGARVYALAPDYDEAIRQQVIAMGAEPVDFELSRAAINPARDIVDTFRLTQLLRKLRPDVTLGYFIKPVIYGTLAAWIAGAPRRIALIEGMGYVFTLSGNDFSIRRRLLRWTVSLMYRVSLACAHKVIVLNNDDIEEMARGGLANPAKIVHLDGIGVDLEKWSLAPAVTAPITFILVARLLREKGVFEYLAAARIVKKQAPTARFILLGAADLNPGSLHPSELQGWVDEGVLEWPGHVDVKPWLCQASVFVLPSFREGLPRSTQEAMAMGRAVITTDVPGCRETVIDGMNGFLVPARDHSALADAMMKFVDNPSLIVTMGQSSHQMAIDRFDVHKINHQFIEVLSLNA